MDRQPALAALLEQALAGPLFTAAELPQPDAAQRRAASMTGTAKGELFATEDG
ncbi:MAG: hypothetical protein KDI73_00065 [Candidatus Competibacteraceae bacterium]|nr:hypothetical protein [Candidatus Competibacteraceae bacterium]